ncbi:hypothetical protein G7K_3581-t1 [Saitoella complicata NRRL Y-17804]|uniref:PXA domain-containing protein n=2 Tax=Saitoella complicata (strain BCRC 22490 / CBS 7301 / JCM 7358 / NBRC 10748 / NRRL Y-17804) TaxID=698492 RepID=A0A0E9NID3_SAICN|nr:hypothetical protein G7K_3581-t1 [Saitoella complicata NRRL Y-17804]
MKSSVSVNSALLAVAAAVAVGIVLGHPLIRWVVGTVISIVTTSIAAIAIFGYVCREHYERRRPEPLRNTRPFVFTRPDIWEARLAEKRAAEGDRRPPYHVYPQSPAVSSSVETFLDLVIRDFVESWANRIAPNPLFPTAAKNAMRFVVTLLIRQITTVDLVGFVVRKLFPILTDHLRDFTIAENAVRGQSRGKALTESDELDKAIARKYRPGRLHEAALGTIASGRRVGQQDWLRSKVEKLLPILLPPNERKSKVVHILVREILACSVLTPIVDMLADPDYWNQTIERVVGQSLRDRKSIKKLRKALDKHEDREQHPPTSRPKAANDKPRVKVDKHDLAMLLKSPEFMMGFVEFMEKRGKSHLLDFYLTVDILIEKHPLENDGIFTVGEMEYSDSDLEDIRQVEALMRPLGSIIPKEMKKVVGQSLAAPTPGVYALARAEILKLQQQVVEMMEENDFPAFQRTDAFAKSAAHGTPTIESGNGGGGVMPALPRSGSTFGENEIVAAVEEALLDLIDDNQSLIRRDRHPLPGVSSPRASSRFDFSAKSSGEYDRLAASTISDTASLESDGTNNTETTVTHDRDQSSTVRILSCTVHAENGESVAKYLIQNHDLALQVTTEVSRRYSEFVLLHNRLRLQFPTVKKLSLPGKRLQVVLKLQKSFLESRRRALERYLQALVRIPEVVNSQDLADFLSGATSPVDSERDVLDEIPDVHILEEHLTPFTEPICNLFLETFQLRKGSNWIRERAFAIILSEFLGGAIERKVRDSAGDAANETAILSVLETVRDSMWPGGQLKKSEKDSERSAEDKRESRLMASVFVAVALPELMGGIVGSKNAVHGARRLFSSFQNYHVNVHLVGVIIDNVLELLFPESLSRENGTDA